MKRHIFIICWVIACGARANVSPAKSTCDIQYPGYAGGDDRYDFPTILLNRIFAVTASEYGKCKLSAGDLMSQKRTVLELKKSAKINVAWLPATRRLEKELLSVKIPIRKGLLGWRLLMINESSQKAFNKIKNLADLQAFRTAFLRDWHDWPVMLANFPHLQAVSSYQSLFRILKQKRIDFISRAIHEIYAEINDYDPNGKVLKVASNLMLYYQQADLFYFSKNDLDLANRVKKGFLALINSGEYERMFMTHYGDIIKKVKDQKRFVIKLNNPFISSNLPESNSEFWQKF